jgi:hypothetical protein
MEMSQKYLKSTKHSLKYRPLVDPDAIRLLLLQPASSNATEVQCELIHTTIPKCDADIVEHYIALSYVWGDEIDVRTVTVDGQILAVTKNLYSALVDLRDNTRTTRFWVDAICINQANNDEKSLQIQLMSRIYATATHTIIYLGQTTRKARAFMLEVQRMAAQRNPKRKILESGAWIDDDILVQGAIDMLSEPWFARVWVFQELVFSKAPWIQCGTLRVKWEDVYCFIADSLQDNSSRHRPAKHNNSAADTIWQHSESLLEKLKNTKKGAYGWKTICIMHETRLQYQGISRIKRNNLDLISLLRTRRGSGASDPRDMIFAHLGFAEAEQDDLISIDYQRPCWEVYRNFAVYQINRDKNFNIFFDVDVSLSKRCKDLPSWVPDWSIPMGNATQSHNTPVNVQDELKKVPMEMNTRLPGIWTDQLHMLGFCGRVWGSIQKISTKTISELVPSERQKQFTSEFSLLRQRQGYIQAFEFDSALVCLYEKIYNEWYHVLGPEISISVDDSKCPDTEDSLGEYDVPLGSSHHRDTLWRLRRHPLSFQGRLLTSFDEFGCFDEIATTRAALLDNDSLCFVPAISSEGDLVCRPRDFNQLCVLRLIEFSATNFNLHEDIDRQVLSYMKHSGESLKELEMVRVIHSKFVGVCPELSEDEYKIRMALAQTLEVFILS